MIELYHFGINKESYQRGLGASFYDAAAPPEYAIRRLLNPTFEQFRDDFVARVNPDLFWPYQHKLHHPQSFIADHLSGPESGLYALTHNGADIGFALAMHTPDDLKTRFFPAATAQAPPPKVAQLDYLALFKGEEGQGRGRIFFEIFFRKFFSEGYDAVYWSQHSTNAPTLFRWYLDKLGMTHLATDTIPDFRPQP